MCKAVSRQEVPRASLMAVVPAEKIYCLTRIVKTARKAIELALGRNLPSGSVASGISKRRQGTVFLAEVESLRFGSIFFRPARNGFLEGYANLPADCFAGKL